MNKKYTLILKTGEAEIRALENTTDKIKDKILPVIELTRGRKLSTRKDQETPAEQYPFDSRFQKIKEIFRNKEVCIDLTSDDALMNNKIATFYNPKNGYENWVNFLIQLKEENIFQTIIPSVIISAEDENFDDNLLKQVIELKKHFSNLLYRNDIVDENCYSDLELLNEELKDINLYVIIDCEYVVQAAQHLYSEKAKARVLNLMKLLNPNTTFIVSSTSFPNNISEIGNDVKDTFKLCEVDIFNDFKAVPSLSNIHYSDYGSINPKRNDNVVMARGWIPRIDVPLQTEIYYYRQRRPKGVSQYSSTYNDVARAVVSDSRFPEELSDNWGILQIINCANGDSPASRPAFWISVRMCIHLEQQVKRTLLY